MVSLGLWRFRSAAYVLRTYEPRKRALSAALATFRTQPVAEHDLRRAVAQGKDPSNLLESLALRGTERPFQKWWHYFETYDRELGLLAAQSRQGDLPAPLRILEIGVQRGGSLGLWREYFGHTAQIWGIDIDPGCSSFSDGNTQVRIGSQSDALFLREVVEEMGGVDVVIDDGSHMSNHIVTSLAVLFPLLSSSGVYLVEDLHAAYWPDWNGGLRRRGSAVEELKLLVDGLHQPYFGQQSAPGPLAHLVGQVRSITFSDSMAVLRKGPYASPEIFLSSNW